MSLGTARLKNDMKNVQSGNNIQYFLSMLHSNYFENILKYHTGKGDGQLRLMNKEIQMPTDEKTYPESLGIRMRSRRQEFHVVPPYVDCYTFLTSNLAKEQTLQSSGVLLKMLTKQLSAITCILDKKLRSGFPS